VKAASKAPHDYVQPDGSLAYARSSFTPYDVVDTLLPGDETAWTVVSPFSPNITLMAQ